MLRHLFVLLLFQCLGELLGKATGLPLPGPIIGMLLLFSTLCLTQTLPTGLIAVSDKLLRHLPMLVMVPAVGLYFLGDLFLEQGLALVAAIVVGTTLSFVFNAVLLKWLMRP